MLLPFWLSAKNSNVWTSLKMSSKEQIEVKLLTSKNLNKSL
jgi:hypothetical protein